MNNNLLSLTNQLNIQSIHDENKEDWNFLINKYNIDKNKYIVPITNNDIYSPDNVINNNNLFDLICAICLNILKNPVSCSSNINSHSFCKECIDIYLEEHDNCPTCKNIFEYKNNPEVEKKLNELLFKCIYFKDGCKNIINYTDYFKHINECEYRNDNILYECLVDKYNYINKSFEPCHYIGKIKEMEEHFKKCAFMKYRCLFCKEDILSIHFIDHAINNCQIRIFNDNDGDIYIGEIKKNKRDGYGIHYYNGDKYKGEWKNCKKNGYGAFFFLNGEKCEGEWKNDKLDGYGQFYFSNGDKYDGEWKEDKMDGYGKFYFSNGDIYDGEWKNNKMNGYGKFYYCDGGICEGEWKDNKIEGYGIVYLSDGKYEAIFQNGRIKQLFNEI